MEAKCRQSLSLYYSFLSLNSANENIFPDVSNHCFSGDQNMIYSSI